MLRSFCERPVVYLGVPIALFLGVRLWLIFAHLDAMTVWLDELFYYSAAYDLLHWGAPGVPHPQLFFYPPLTSLVTAAAHLPGWPAPWPYQLSLVILSVVVASVAVAGSLLYRELFGHTCRFLGILLLVTSPAYLGLTLMSEPLFLALFVWYLLFFARFLARRRSGDAIVAALLIVLMMLTRPNAVGFLPVMAVSFVFERLVRWRWGWRCGSSLGYLYLLGIPALGYAGWKLLHARLADPGNWNLGAGEYLSRTARGVLAAPSDALALAHKFFANLGYIWLTGFGLAAAVVVVYLVHCLWRRRTQTHDQSLLLFLVHVGAFALFAAGVAVLHMYVYGGADTPEPKYAMYGRYVEYFTVPLFVVAFGLLARLHEHQDLRRRWILGGLAVGTAVALVLVPEVVVRGLVTAEGVQVTPNHQGIGWLLVLISGLGRKGAMVAALGLSCLLVALFLASAYRQTPWWRYGTRTILVLLLVANAWLPTRHVTATATHFAALRDPFSTYISAHPELFVGGLYLEGKIQDRSSDRFQVLTVYADHLDRALLGTSPQAFLGDRPVLSRRRFPGYEILAPAEPWTVGDGARLLYGTRQSVLEPLPQLWLGRRPRPQGQRLSVPVHLHSAGQGLRGLAFALELDAQHLHFDPADHDGDGLADALRPAQVSARQFQVDTVAGEGRILFRLDGQSIPISEGLLFEVDVELSDSTPAAWIRGRWAQLVQLAPHPIMSDLAGRSIIGYARTLPFLDGFESGDLSHWTVVSGATARRSRPDQLR